MNKCRFPNAYAIPQAFERKMKEIKIYERVEVECEYVKVLQYNYLILIITVRVVWVFATILLESNGHACPTEEGKKKHLSKWKTWTHITLDNSQIGQFYVALASIHCHNDLFFSDDVLYFVCMWHLAPSTVHRASSSITL